MLDKLEQECSVHREMAWNKDRALEVCNCIWFYCLFIKVLYIIYRGAKEIKSFYLILF